MYLCGAFLLSNVSYILQKFLICGTDSRCRLQSETSYAALLLQVARVEAGCKLLCICEQEILY